MHDPLAAEPELVWRVNHKPRFTALEMGEYMAADEAPRETMLRNMKYERMARSLSYRTLSQHVVSFLASPTRDGRILARCRELLESERAAAMNPKRREQFGHQINALDAFERSMNALQVAGLTFERVSSKQNPLQFEGVTINVLPTAMIRARRARGSDLLGALIVDLAKGDPLRTEDARGKAANAMLSTAMLLHQHVAALCGEEAKPSAEHCVVFHSYRGERVCCPSSYRTAMRNLAALCRGVARAWPDIQPPASFDERMAKHRR